MFFVEEFEIIYVDTLPSSRESITLHFLTVGCTKWLGSKITEWKGERQTNFMLRKPDTHYLSQVIKININCHEQYW